MSDLIYTFTQAITITEKTKHQNLYPNRGVKPTSNNMNKLFCFFFPFCLNMIKRSTIVCLICKLFVLLLDRIKKCKANLEEVHEEAAK